MTPLQFTKIRKVAQDVRKGLLNDYGRSICGMCGAASRDIRRICEEEHGIELELVIGTFMGFDHTWCELDGYVIDVTVDQFSGILPGIAIIKVGDWTAYKRNRRDTRLVAKERVS
jgi:hypothetical protein